MNNDAYKSKYMKYNKKYLELKEILGGAVTEEVRQEQERESRIFYEDYINSLLVIKKVRKAYLIQNHEPTDSQINKRITNIQKIFPTLILLKDGTYYYLSEEKLTIDDTSDNIKIGKILRFDCDEKFDDLDLEKLRISYNINVYLKYIKNPISIITYVCQTKSRVESARKLVSDIKDVLINEDYLKDKFMKIELKINDMIPAKSFIPKLIDKKHKFTEPEKIEMYNIIDNIMNKHNYIKIKKEIDFNNILHRGIMLSFLSEHEHNYYKYLPIQELKYFEQISEIEDKRINLILDILIESKK